MIKMTTEICVDVPIDIAWRHMSRVDEVHLWAHVLQDSYAKTEQTRGKGTERACVLANGKTITETFTHWEEGKAFTYAVTEGGPAILKYAQNTWTLEGEEGGKTMIRSHVEMACNWGVVGKVLEPLIMWGIKRDMPNIAASLKYFVETGKAFDGDVKTLPRAPSFC
jgi:hypothetical protein